MKQKTKEVNLFLQAMAMQLPAVYEESNCSIPTIGEDILADPDKYRKLLGKYYDEVEANKTYNLPGTMQKTVNHFKRMKKYAKKHGAERAAQYYHECKTPIILPETLAGIYLMND